MKTENTHSGPLRLPVVELKGETYFVDLRLRQLRATANPGKYVDFEDEWELRWYLSKRGITQSLEPQ